MASQIQVIKIDYSKTFQVIKPQNFKHNFKVKRIMFLMIIRIASTMAIKVAYFPPLHLQEIPYYHHQLLFHPRI